MGHVVGALKRFRQRYYAFFERKGYGPHIWGVLGIEIATLLAIFGILCGFLFTAYGSELSALFHPSKSPNPENSIVNQQNIQSNPGASISQSNVVGQCVGCIFIREGSTEQRPQDKPISSSLVQQPEPPARSAQVTPPPARPLPPPTEKTPDVSRQHRPQTDTNWRDPPVTSPATRRDEGLVRQVKDNTYLRSSCDRYAERERITPDMQILILKTVCGDWKQVQIIKTNKIGYLPDSEIAMEF